MLFLDSCHLYNADIPRLCYYNNLPILTTFSHEACLGRIKYLPLLALFLFRNTCKRALLSLSLANYQQIKFDFNYR